MIQRIGREVLVGPDLLYSLPPVGPDLDLSLVGVRGNGLCRGRTRANAPSNRSNETGRDFVNNERENMGFARARSCTVEAPGMHDLKSVVFVSPRPIGTGLFQAMVY